MLNFNDKEVVILEKFDEISVSELLKKIQKLTDNLDKAILYCDSYEDLKLRYPLSIEEKIRITKELLKDLENQKQ